MSGSTYREAALGNAGGWSAERLALIPQYKARIVELIASELFLSEICLELDISPGAVRIWRQQDKSFDEAYTDAEASVTDSLEKEAIRRAKNGVLEPVISQGKVVMEGSEPLMVRRYSDSLMQFLLRGRRRDVYGDKREVDAKVGIDMTGAKDSLATKFAAAQTAGETS
jgi:transposase-like protein